MTKPKMFDLGCQLMQAWCITNNVTIPNVCATWTGKCAFGVCAYYRSSVIHIWPNMCAIVGTAGRQWSYLGYAVDRTPFGVLQHELGHHVDNQPGAQGGTLSHLWRPIDPNPLTSYCPNDNEWFAELFRLFVTNPHLLSCIRPLICQQFAKQWQSVETRTWLDVLASAPRQLHAASRRIQRGI